MQKFSFLILLILLTSCTTSEPPEIKSIGHFKIKTQNGLKVSAEVEVFNPNDFGATLQNLNVTISLDENTIGQVKHAEETRIRANKITNVPIEADLNDDLIKKTIRKFGFQLITGKKVPLRVTGEILIKAGMKKHKIEVSDIQEIDLKMLAKSLL